MTCSTKPTFINKYNQVQLPLIESLLVIALDKEILRGKYLPCKKL